MSQKERRAKHLQYDERDYYRYYSRLKGIAISTIEWINLPNSVSVRNLEETLYENGNAVYFNDEILGNLALALLPNGKFDVYGNPKRRIAISNYNNYRRYLNRDDSVVIWENMSRNTPKDIIASYSRKLAHVDRVIYVNLNGQKTPVIVKSTEEQRLTMLNLYRQFDASNPFIFGDSSLNLDSLTSLRLDIPYLVDKLYEYRINLWNEALNYLGVTSVNIEKRERLISDEVNTSQGGALASRYSRLGAREEAVRLINEMFGLNIQVRFKDLGENVSRETSIGEREDDYE